MTPEQAVRRRQERHQARLERLRAVAALRAQNLTWADIAEQMGLGSRQRAQQLHAEAVAEGIDGRGLAEA